MNDPLYDSDIPIAWFDEHETLVDRQYWEQQAREHPGALDDYLEDANADLEKLCPHLCPQDRCLAEIILIRDRIIDGIEHPEMEGRLTARG